MKASIPIRNKIQKISDAFIIGKANWVLHLT